MNAAPSCAPTRGLARARGLAPARAPGCPATARPTRTGRPAA